jgi:hypothetical protein
VPWLYKINCSNPYRRFADTPDRKGDGNNGHGL